MCSPAARRGATVRRMSHVTLLAGASGLVGSQLLQQLLADRATACVHALLRKPLSRLTARVTRDYLNTIRTGAKENGAQPLPVRPV